MKLWQNKTKINPAPSQGIKGDLPLIDRKYEDTQIETATFALG